MTKRLRQGLLVPHSVMGKAGHNPAIKDNLLKLGPVSRLHYSLQNTTQYKASPKPIWSTEFKFSLDCIPSVRVLINVLIAHQDRATVLWHGHLARGQEMSFIQH